MPALPSVPGHAPSAYAAPTLDSISGGVPAVSPIASERLSHSALATDFDGARILSAVVEPVLRAPCRTLLPQASPVEVQVDGRTIMHLHSEPDRVAFLDENRVGALWMELLDATRAADGCPTNAHAGDVPLDISARMACLGVGAGERGRTDVHSPLEANFEMVSDLPRATSPNVDASEFATVEALSLPSVYIREPGFAPGTMAALEYDLGWRALAPSWRAVMPIIDESVWASDPNTELFCAVGRAVLPHLATREAGNVADTICARIVAFHMHAGGLVDCLSNVTRSVERMGKEGEVARVAAIEINDFLVECAGIDWRKSLIGREGEDALTRRRAACTEAATNMSTTELPADVDTTTSESDGSAPKTDDHSWNSQPLTYAWR
ncbi:hypothetical protein PAQ31011_03213 [Pandoraea aquatica]|uniref:Uncharacterized protein n=1 Tax=Pandoraea aquatica TaxID=2508290 RepID=A0A5E4WFH7_9BURK|nr:hypothetical protein [Pandoraea aquatica]VVE22180.1 hypothetical protein PAQ31011_03213 [Pandoraea aquatica]